MFFSNYYKRVSSIIAFGLTDLDVDGNLEVIFLLANESFVRVGEVETFVSIHPECRQRSVKFKKTRH